MIRKVMLWVLLASISTASYAYTCKMGAVCETGAYGQVSYELTKNFHVYHCDVRNLHGHRLSKFYHPSWVHISDRKVNQNPFVVRSRLLRPGKGLHYDIFSHYRAFGDPDSILKFSTSGHAVIQCTE